MDDRGSEALAVRLAGIRARHAGAVPEMVAEVVRAVLDTMAGDLCGSQAVILDEITALGRIIAAAKAEIAALPFEEITASHIPGATDELDAIIAHTAQATEAILETCETLDRVGSEIEPILAAQLQTATTRIYEACGFQDITGQRITKVVATLKAIDAQVVRLVATLSAAGTGSADAPPRPAPPAGSEPALLNGPQLRAAAMAQPEIDRLLASHD